MESLPRTDVPGTSGAKALILNVPETQG